MRLDLLPFVQAKWFIPLDARQIDYVVIHDMEAPELLGTAEAVANYFTRVDRKASVHLNCDADSIVRSVADKDIAYGAGGVNHNGLHIEHAGYANQSFAEWLDVYGRQMLALSAEAVREWCRIYAIPIVYVDADGLRRGDRGITTHLQASIAFGGDHWDPGYEFPIDYYIDLVKGEDMPTAQEIAAAHWEYPVTVHSYNEDRDITIPMWQLKAYEQMELQQIRRLLEQDDSYAGPNP